MTPNICEKKKRIAHAIFMVAVTEQFLPYHGQNGIICEVTLVMLVMVVVVVLAGLVVMVTVLR